MLKQLGRLERTRSIIIVGFAVIMAVSLIIFYAPGRSARYLDPSKNTEVVATVGKHDITVADVALQKETFQSTYGGQYNLARFGFTNRRILDGLIQQKIVLQEAERLGLLPSEADVANEIRKEFKDAGVDPDKDPARYRERATAIAGDVERFEEQYRNRLALRNLRAFVTSSVNVSDEDVQKTYERNNTTISLNYVLLSADKLAEKIQPSDDELRSYFEQHKTDYRLLEPQKKVSYVYINQEKAGSKIQIPDKDLRADFELLKPENKEAGVKVQQIVLKVARKDLDAQVEQKAKDLLAKVRGIEGKGDEKAFAEMARGQSEDPVTAKAGGFLPRLIKRNPNKPDGLYDRVLDMQPGDISDIPIKFANNWYILRRGESVQQTFEEAKPTLLVSARNRRSYAVAQKLAERAQTRLKETRDPKKVAQELAAEANMNPAEMVKETPYIKPGDDVPDIGSNQQFEQEIAGLNNAGDVGERAGVKGGFAIPMFIDKKDPRIPEFEEVKSKINDTLKQQRAKEQLEQRAKEIASQVKSVQDLKAAGERAGFEVGTEEDWKVGAALGKGGTSSALDETAFKLKAGEFTRTPVKLGNNWAILGATNRTEADLAAFASQRNSLTQSLLSERQNQVWSDYLSAVEDQMKRDGKIEINEQVLATLVEEEPVAAPPQFPQIPIPTK